MDCEPHNNTLCKLISVLIKIPFETTVGRPVSYIHRTPFK